MQVRCVHCSELSDIEHDSDLARLTCPSCGGSINLVDQKTVTYQSSKARQLGHFELLELVGSGGFGSVWKARDQQIDRTVAVKVPRKEHLSTNESELFFREARAAGRLRHPNIVTVHEVGRADDTVYIVCDFINGASLQDWLTARRPTPRESAELCRRIAIALHYAHEQGVVHRDLKPANVMMDLDGQPHLMDFGLARRVAGDATMTVEGRVMGTPAFMSPEQARGEGHRADRRSDVYSLGVILYRLLTGELPFRGNAQMLIVQILQDDPPSPRKLDATLPIDLETICLKCLEKDPAKRFATAEALADELGRFLDGRPIQSRPIGRIERAVKWVKRNRVVAAAMTSVFVALLVGTIVSTTFGVKARYAANRAETNEKLAGERAIEADKERNIAKKAAEESRYRAVRFAVANGHRFRDAGELNQALLWYARAWKLDDPENISAAETHRLRVGCLISQLSALQFVGFHDAPVKDAQFSPDAERILTHTGGAEAFVWSAQNSELAFPSLKHSGPLQHAAYSPDGTRIAVAAGKEITLWNAADGKSTERLKHDAQTLYCAFNHDGRLMASCSADGKVRLWDLATKTVKQVLPLSSDDPPVFAAFNATGDRLITANRDKGAQLWNPATGKPVGGPLLHEGRHQKEQHRIGATRRPEFRWDGRRIAISTSAQLFIIDAADGKTLIERRWYGRPLLFTADGSRFLRFSGSVAYVHDAENGFPQGALKHSRASDVGACSPDGLLFATASTGGFIHLWDSTNGSPIKTWSNPRCGSDVATLSFSADSRRLLAASNDGTARVWEVRRREPEAYRGDCGALSNMSGAYTADGSLGLRLVKGGKGLEGFTPTNPKAPPHWTKEFSEPAKAVRLTPDGSRGVAWFDSGLNSFDGRTGRDFGPKIPVPYPQVTLQIGHDHLGRNVALGESRTSFGVWRLETGERIFGPIELKVRGPRRFVHGEDGEINSLAISPNGRYVAAAVLSTGEVELWDVESKRRVPLANRGGNNAFLTFSDDSKFLLIYGSDTMARVWNVATGEPAPPPLHSIYVHSARLSPDNRTVVSNDAHSNLRVWDAATGDLIRHIAMRELTAPPEVYQAPWGVSWFSSDARRVIGGIRVHTPAAPGSSRVLRWSFDLRRFGGSLDNLDRVTQLTTGMTLDETDGVEPIDGLQILAGRNEFRQAFLTLDRPSASAKEQRDDSAIAAEPDPNRRAAKWVLSHGGELQIRDAKGGRAVRNVNDLPNSAFVLVSANLRGKRTVDDFGLRHLVGAGAILTLDLGRTGVTDAGMIHVSKLTKLNYLHIGATRVGDAGLAQLRNLRQLRLLAFYHTAVTDDGVEHLRNFSNLLFLDVGATQMTNKAFATIGALTSLEHLEFGGGDIDDSVLPRIQGLVRLKFLGIGHSAITDDGLPHLKNFASLETLNLSLSNAGVKHFFHLKTLKELTLANTRISEQGLAALKAALPQCKVVLQKP